MSTMSNVSIKLSSCFINFCPLIFSQFYTVTGEVPAPGGFVQVSLSVHSKFYLLFFFSALAYKNITYDYRDVVIIPGVDEQLKPEYLTVNPIGQVPSLVIEHEGKSITLFQSIAIINFLEEKYPNAPKLIPNDAMSKYRVQVIVDTICSGIQPLQNLPVLDKLNKFKDGAGAEWAKQVIERGFFALEKILEETSGKFCVGNEFTLADICLVPQVYNANRYGVDVSKYPLIEKLNKALENHPAIAASHPSKQPDAPK